MKYMQKSSRFVFFVVTLCVIILHISCAKYDYSSPLPGIVDIRLRTISDTTRIPFISLNNFVIIVDNVVATRSDQAKAAIYADLKAIDRKPENLNTLSPQAADSSLILGQSYLPPGDYSAIEMSLSPGFEVLLDGYRHIQVETLPDFDPILKFHSAFKVYEQRATKIVLTINLDSSLVTGSDKYTFKPYYYISSIQYQ